MAVSQNQSKEALTFVQTQRISTLQTPFTGTTSNDQIRPTTNFNPLSLSKYSKNRYQQTSDFGMVLDDPMKVPISYIGGKITPEKYALLYNRLDFIEKKIAIS